MKFQEISENKRVVIKNNEFFDRSFLFLTAFSSIDTDKLRLVLGLIHRDQAAQ